MKLALVTIALVAGCAAIDNEYDRLSHPQLGGWLSLHWDAALLLLSSNSAAPAPSENDN